MIGKRPLPSYTELTEYLKSHDRDGDLSTVESVQQVRAVWKSEECKLYFVCTVEIGVAKFSGEKTVGADLGINDFAALSYEDGHGELYSLNCLKQDDHYIRSDSFAVTILTPSKLRG